MTTALDALKQRTKKAGRMSAKDAMSLVAVVEAVGQHGHPLTCKGCREVLEAARALLREIPRLKAMGKAGGGLL